MHLAGIDGDRVARTGLHHAAATQRLLGSALHDADAILIMPVARKGMARLGFDGFDAGHTTAQHPELTCNHLPLA